jgi:predicted RNase H-like HicB family nuclease
MIIFYPAIIERGRAGFGVFFPDLPGCVSAGDTIQEAAENAQEALSAHLTSAEEYGDPIPRPTSLEQLQPDPDIDEVGRILVGASPATALARAAQWSLPSPPLAMNRKQALAYTGVSDKIFRQAERRQRIRGLPIGRSGATVFHMDHLQRFVAELFGLQDPDDAIEFDEDIGDQSPRSPASGRK